jgi:hypothetical protein
MEKRHTKDMRKRHAKDTRKRHASLTDGDQVNVVSWGALIESV